MQIDYNSYQAQRENAARSTTNGNANSRPPINFLNAYLKKDGDVAIVRFPYNAINDFKVDLTHLVKFPTDKFARRVECTGTDCEFCKQNIKRDARVFLKLLAYVPDENKQIIPVVAVWDRPAPFVDIDIRALLEQCEDNGYGKLSDNLVKIKRSGEGTNTRYTASILHNAVVYPPEIYRADFNLLENVHPEKVFMRSADQYKSATSEAAQTQETPASPIQQTSHSTSAASYSALNPSSAEHQFAAPQPAVELATQPASQPFATPAAQPSYGSQSAQPASYGGQSDQLAMRRPIRRTF